MVYVADPGTGWLLPPLLAALYALWSAAWLAVAYHYGKAAYISWRAAGGKWGRAVAEVLQPFAWALRAAVCNLAPFKRSALCTVEQVPSPYSSGHLLRFAIFLGSLTPALWGMFMLVQHSSHLTSADHAVNLAGLCISIVAAASHLLVAYKSRPRAWSAAVTLSVVWILTAPVALVLLGAL